MNSNLKSVINKETKVFLFLCADPDYRLEEEQEFINSVPPDDLSKTTLDENGFETNVFNCRWDGKNWIAL